MMKRKAKGLICIAILGSMLVGCGNKEVSTTASDMKSGDVELTYCVNSSNASAGVTHDPAVDYTGSRSLFRGTCETLFVLDDDTKEVKGFLCSDWKQTDDTTWTFTIREGITFTNGNPLDAEACRAALDYIFTNNTRLGTLADVSSMEADGQVLTVHTNKICAILPRILSDSNAIIFDTTASEDYSKGLVGTGPYILDSVDAEGNCELSRNENYWQGMPAASKVYTKADLSADAVTLAMQSGELDWASVSDSDLKLFEGNDDYVISEYNGRRVYYLYVNPNYTFTQDPALREALTYAFNRQEIVDGVYAGHGSTTRSIFTEDSQFYTEEYLQPDFDQNKAKELLTAAGYTDTDGDGFVEKDGEPVKLNITYYDKNGFKTLSEVIQSQLKAIGIDSEITVTDSITDTLMNGEYNLGTYGYNTETLGDCYNYLQPVFGTGATSNFTKFSNENVDRLLDELTVTADEEQRAKIAQEMQQYLYTENDHIYLMHVLNYQVAKKEVRNLTAQFGSDQGDASILWKITKE